MLTGGGGGVGTIADGLELEPPPPQAKSNVVLANMAADLSKCEDACFIIRPLFFAPPQQAYLRDTMT